MSVIGLVFVFGIYLKYLYPNIARGYRSDIRKKGGRTFGEF